MRRICEADLNVSLMESFFISRLKRTLSSTFFSFFSGFFFCFFCLFLILVGFCNFAPTIEGKQNPPPGVRLLIAQNNTRELCDCFLSKLSLFTLAILPLPSKCRKFKLLSENKRNFVVSFYGKCAIVLF